MKKETGGKSTLAIQTLMMLEEKEEYEALQRFRKTPMGKLLDKGRYKNKVTICLTPSGFISALEKHKDSHNRFFILDEYLSRNKK